ncbi:class II fructose-bisphosphate aldolase [Mesobacillus foraminis]|uniref:class II fructose-bisphosphate aldolase n=1 Tax=Mesobacillus foraminis TaxID=279826 RepID=UPI00214C6FF5|nr:class II fructose-bisphosphate aldolase [Mesobacillus foraminis]
MNDGTSGVLLLYFFRPTVQLPYIGGTEEGIHVEEDDKVYTDPKDAAEFVRATGVDALAIAIGTNHGQYKSKTEVNVPLLKKINEAVDVPLVIHGGTGVKEMDIHELINNGIRKFNVGTELLIAWTKTAKETFGETKVTKSLRHNIIPCNQAVKEIVKHKIGIFMVTIRLVADLDVLFERQKNGDLDPTRHLSHIVTSYKKGDHITDRSMADNLLTYGEFIERCTTRGYDTFELGSLYEVDVTDYSKVNYHKLLKDIRENLSIQ